MAFRDSVFSHLGVKICSQILWKQLSPLTKILGLLARLRQVRIGYSCSFLIPDFPGYLFKLKSYRSSCSTAGGVGQLPFFLAVLFQRQMRCMET